MVILAERHQKSAKKQHHPVPNNYRVDKFPTSCETNVGKHVSSQHKNESNPLRNVMFTYRDRLF